VVLEDDISDGDEDFKPPSKKQKLISSRSNSQDNGQQKVRALTIPTFSLIGSYSLPFFGTNPTNRFPSQNLKEWSRPDFFKLSTTISDDPRLSQGKRTLSQGGAATLAKKPGKEDDDEIPQRNQAWRPSSAAPAATLSQTSSSQSEKSLTLDTLAVHPKKVEEVREWLRNCDFKVGPLWFPPPPLFPEN